MYPERPLAAGVNYPSNLGYPCQGGRVELEQMKSWLAATGWQFVAKLECGLEVYSSQAQVS
jgi:hypothetical protein